MDAVRSALIQGGQDRRLIALRFAQQKLKVPDHAFAKGGLAIAEVELPESQGLFTEFH